jgi:hypothetical protein
MQRGITILLSLVSLMVFTRSIAAADEEPEPKSAAAVKAKADFQTKFNELEEEYKAKLTKLREQYYKGLDDARKAAIDKNDLNEAQRILAAKTFDQENALVAPGLSILFAAYGSEARNGWINVTEAVRKKVKNNRVRFQASRAGFDDPNFGVKKSVVVVYTVNGKIWVIVRGQDEVVEVPQAKP